MNLNNSKSAKEYISEAYAQKLQAIQEKAKLLETPASIIAKEKTEKTFKMAEALLSRDILSPEVTSEYSNLLSDIQAKKEELKKLYGVETAPDALQAVKSAAAFISEQFTQELTQKDDDFKKKLNADKEAFDEKIKAKNEETQQEVKAIEQQTKERKSTEAQRANREKAEYEYNLKRSRNQEKDDRAKAVAEREKALRMEEEEAYQVKQQCLDKLAEIDELSKKVDGIAAMLETAKMEGASAKEKELGKKYGYEKYLADKDHERDVSDLQEELSTLQKKYDALCKEKAALSVALEDYNAKNYQLAVDTAKSGGGTINVVSNDNNQYGSQGKK